jgi:hypothetical protein
MGHHAFWRTVRVWFGRKKGKSSRRAGDDTFDFGYGSVWFQYLGHQGKHIAPFAKEMWEELKVAKARDEYDADDWSLRRMEDIYRQCLRNADNYLWSDQFCHSPEPLTLPSGEVVHGYYSRLDSNWSDMETGPAPCPITEGSTAESSTTKWSTTKLKPAASIKEYRGYQKTRFVFLPTGEYMNVRTIHPDDLARLPSQVYVTDIRNGGYRYRQRAFLDICRAGNLPMVKLMMENGMDIRWTNYLPLRVAISMAHVNLVKYMLTPHTSITGHILGLLLQEAQGEMKVLIYQCVGMIPASDADGSAASCSS